MKFLTFPIPTTIETVPSWHKKTIVIKAVVQKHIFLFVFAQKLNNSTDLRAKTSLKNAIASRICEEPKKFLD